MNKKVAMLTACLAASALLLAVNTVRAAEDGDGGGSTATAEQMPDICKDQAAKQNLTGAEADDFVEKCSASIGNDIQRSAKPDEKLEGSL
jgi:predicted small secreted protein